MTATMLSMEFVLADLLTASQLMEGDYIKIHNEIVYVENVTDDATGDNYLITYTNDFSESEQIELPYDTKIELYVISDD